MIRKYIEKIGENRNVEDMEKLGDMLSEIIEETKDSHPEIYHQYKIELYEMAYGKKISEEMAENIVENMKPLSEHWDIETIKSVLNNDTHRLEDMYVVMNSLANDYENVISLEDVQTYVKMAHAWLDDIDGHNNKVWWYFVER